MSETAITQHWVVDQINGQWVKLSSSQYHDLYITLPLELCPPHIKEGQSLALSLNIDEAQSQVEQAKIDEALQALSADDDGGDFSL